MNMTKKIKTYTLEELTDKHVGNRGTEKREQFEFELKLEILGDMIKKARKDQNLTQEQLGQLIGVQKAQISKIENNAKDVRFSTVLRVFDALKAKVKMRVEFDHNSFYELA
jgi:DNA-binding XRE family transcriptional regulator